MDILEAKRWHQALSSEQKNMLPQNNSLPSHNAAMKTLSNDFGNCDVSHAWITLASKISLQKIPTEHMDTFFRLQNKQFSNEAITENMDDLNNCGNWLNNIRNAITSSTLVHEETHFYQLTGTSFGRFLAELDRVFAFNGSILTRYLAECSPNSFPSLPLYRWIKKMKLKGVSDNRKNFIYIMNTFLHPLYMKLAFFGNINNLDDMQVAQPLKIEVALELWKLYLDSYDRVERLYASGNSNKLVHPLAVATNLPKGSYTCPIINNRFLSALDIFEGAALEAQLGWIRSTFRGKPILPWLIRLTNPGWINQEYIATRRIIAQMLPDWTGICRRSLLLILSDLALNGPTHNDYFAQTKERVDWEDLHPGYRFKRSLEVIKGSDVRLTGNVIEDYKPITEYICDELNWDYPEEMAKQLIQTSALSPKGFTYEDPLFSERVRAAKARLEGPAFFAEQIGKAEFVIPSKYKLGPSFVVDNGKLSLNKDDECLQTETIPTLYSTAICRTIYNLFLNDSIYPVFIEPEDVRNEIYKRTIEFYFGENVFQNKSIKDFLKITPIATNNIEMDIIDKELKLASNTDLQSIITELEDNDLGNIAATLKIIELIKEPIGIKWYSIQPTIINELFGLFKLDNEGKFMEIKGLLNIIGRYFKYIDNDLFDLIEDSGLVVLMPDLLPHIHKIYSYFDKANKALISLSPEARALLFSIETSFGGNVFDDIELIDNCKKVFIEKALQELLSKSIIREVGRYPLSNEKSPIGILITQFCINKNWRDLALALGWPNNI